MSIIEGVDAHAERMMTVSDASSKCITVLILFNEVISSCQIKADEPKNKLTTPMHKVGGILYCHLPYGRASWKSKANGR